jgi:glycerol-3-phosphate acyltransferase PlsY
MLVCFFAIVLMTRFVSLAAIMCAFLYPLLIRAFVPDMGTAQLMAILTTVFVIFMHRENIKRLYNGKESKISFSRKKKATDSAESSGGAV